MQISDGDDSYLGSSFRWDSTGVIVAGNGSYGNGSHQVSYPFGIYVDSNDVLYVADYSFNRIQRWLPNATSGTTVAGSTSTFCSRNASAFCYPVSVYVDQQQTIYISDNSGIRRWPSGASSGTFLSGSSSYTWVYGLDMDTDGNFYASATFSNQVVRWTNPAMNPQVVAGGNGWGYSSSHLMDPQGIAVDSSTKTIYIANSQTHSVVAWKINSTSGTIVAGRNMSLGAGSKMLRYPSDVKLDSLRNLYVLDRDNYRIMMYCAIAPDLEPKSIINLEASDAYSMAFDSKMNIYVSYPNLHRVMKYNRLG